MTLPEYLADVAKEMRIRSGAIRRAFATHKLSAGENREDLVANFLKDHLPRRFGIDTGLMVSSDGQFSSQADVVVVDHHSNAPLHVSGRNKLWPVESVYSLVEVKTQLSPRDIEDALAKCRRFKKLNRQFIKSHSPMRQSESLFVLWGYDCAEPLTVKTNLIKAMREVPRSECIDLVVVPDKLVARGGSYMELARLGQEGSDYRAKLHAEHGPDLSSLLPDAVEVDAFGDNALMAWFVWFDSWLRTSDLRSCDPVRYVPPGNWGARV